MSYQPRTLDTLEIKPRPVLDDITVVIPTLGRAILEESLYWIVAGNAWPREIIVVDQSSSSSVAAKLERLRSLGIVAKHVPSSQRGKPAALNRGIEQVRTHFLAITDDDCFVESDWLKNMMKHLHEYSAAVITGPAHPAGTEKAVATVISRKPTISCRPRLKFDLFCGSNMGATVGVFRKAGLFDEDPCFLSAAEDCEWAYRALRAGVSIIYVQDVIVLHFGWRDIEQRAVRYRAYARSHGGFYGKYLRQGDWFIAMRVVIHHLRALRRWLRGIVTDDQEAALYARAYLTGLLPGIIAGMRRSKKS